MEIEIHTHLLEIHQTGTLNFTQAAYIIWAIEYMEYMEGTSNFTQPVYNIQATQYIKGTSVT